MRSDTVNSPPAANDSLERNPLLLILLPSIEWSLWRILNAIFTLTRHCKCKVWANNLLETSGIKLKFVFENVYDKPRQETIQTVVSFPSGGQPDEGKNAVPTMQRRRVVSPLLSICFVTNVLHFSKISKFVEFCVNLVKIVNYFGRFSICGSRGFTPKKCLVRRCRSDGSQFLRSGIGMGLDFCHLVQEWVAISAIRYTDFQTPV